MGNIQLVPLTGTDEFLVNFKLAGVSKLSRDRRDNYWAHLWRPLGLHGFLNALRGVPSNMTGDSGEALILFGTWK